MYFYVCAYVFIHVCMNTVLARASINFFIFFLSFHMPQERVIKDQKVGDEMELSIVFNIFYVFYVLYYSVKIFLHFY